MRLGRRCEIRAAEGGGCGDFGHLASEAEPTEIRTANPTEYAEVQGFAERTLRRIRLIGRGDAGAVPGGFAEALFQSGQEEEDVFGPAGVAHEADAPGFAFEVAQAAADFDAEFGEKFFADGEVFDAGGDFNGVELGELVVFGGEIFDAEGGEARF